ncbi:vWA domain-containing protein [Winogradskyella alexanderae]|uniref:VWFA domain-containing protein n=1 Tax=Winogradskyella alexanderae TaxID=2877123 RepID=A0ABS7XWK3_9FLAO|nr:hypothetical protein [Winogradskyella alexanderae]MCA0133211.1 hypothetical protein [Winogradskyella alexanderae]
MKTLFQFVIVLGLYCSSYSQEKNIETESIAIEHLISFMVEQFSVNSDTIPQRNITFLLETYAPSFNTQDRVILRQAFKLLSERLTQNDSVSIVAYSKYNGIILERTDTKNVKKLLYAVENPISSISFLEKDGIGLAYNMAKKNFSKNTENSVVMIRIPNNEFSVNDSKRKNVSESQNLNRRNKNTVLLTAIALLPELIKVIKD